MVLSAEEAKQRLDALADPGWREAAGGRIGRLKRRWRGPVQEFVDVLEPAVAGRRYYALHKEAEARRLSAAELLDGLTPAELDTVMSALHPGLGAALARWWQDSPSQPYLRGWSRRAFRAVGNPGLTRPARARELYELVQAAGPYDADPAWLAAWAGYLGRRVGESPGATGSLLAAAVDRGGPDGAACLRTLVAVTTGEEPVGLMSRSVVTALLRCADPEAWGAVERLLLAAQRQEGLRQVVLESADEGHPQAFDRILRVVLDHDLLRFAASVRAAGVWLGLPASVEDLPAVRQRVEALLGYRSDESARQAAVAGGPPQDAYLGLVVGGMRDVSAAVREAEAMLGHPDPERRAVAVRFLSVVQLTTASARLGAVIDDPDVRVACLAVACADRSTFEAAHSFERLERLLARLPEKAGTVESFGAEVVPLTVSRAAVVGHLVHARGDRPVSRLVPWVSVMDTWQRQQVARLLGEQERLGTEERALLLRLVGDRSSNVRQAAVAAAARLVLEPSEARSIEALLTRSATDVRRAALTLLSRQPRAAALQSAERLEGGDAAQRRGADELRSTLGGAAPTADAPPAAPPADVRQELTGDSVRSEPRVPRPSFAGRDAAEAKAARALGAAVVAALDDAVEQNRDRAVTLTSWQGSRELLLADLRWLPSPFSSALLPVGPDEPESSGMVAPELFRPVFDELAGDRPGLVALRAYVQSWHVRSDRDRFVPTYLREPWSEKVLDQVLGQRLALRHPQVVQHVLSWLVAEHADRDTVHETLDLFETVLAAVPASVVDAVPDTRGRSGIYSGSHAWLNDWRRAVHALPSAGLLDGLLARRPELFGRDELDRLFGVARWLEQPRPFSARRPIERRLLVSAYEAGVATDADVVDAFLTWPDQLFRDLTRRWRTPLVERHPRLVEIADRVRDAVVAAELGRGDLPTPTSAAASAVSSTTGAELAATLLQSLGRSSLVRGWTRGSDARDAVLSHLLRVCFPAPGDSAGTLRDAAAARQVPVKRLVDLAVYAPQWARLVEDALAWPGLADAVLWLHAHTKDAMWFLDQQIRESWTALTAELTPLDAQDLLDGAVDVDWFARSHATLGAERWAQLDKAAKLTSSGSGHRRAQVFAQAMLGESTEDDLVERIHDKRHQDAVRALGLLPVPRDAQGRPDEDTLLRRYRLLREFERGSRAFGSQRQASEQTAVRVGVDNLARTAGYPDPQRFVWAMEAAEAGDLSDGPVRVRHDDVTVTLSVTDEGVPVVDVVRAGRPLKAVPAPLRKQADVAELRSRKTALTRQAGRVRRSLEDAMVARDWFTADDLAALDRHPLVRPMLDLLVWVDEDGVTAQRRDGSTTSAAGDPVSLSPRLRLAHPLDLVTDGNWIAWQERLFEAGRRQPYKQVFRELYVPTPTEVAAGPVSNRYEGHQVQPRQALALLGSRGWLTDRDSGDAARVFHAHDVVARLGFVDGFLTPQEVDLPTVDGVVFTRRSSREAIPLGSVPPVVFSEAMRDVDLVVSVAHAGGVDPEASASTTEMRAALVRETARLLKLGNVTVAGQHVLVDGDLGEYSIHLGSAVVHRRPGGQLCIVPVGSQHRGRLFLPFADDDPRTAEVVAKVVLLAKDRAIKDPTILEQLTA